jgi:hypothetical protein
MCLEKVAISSCERKFVLTSNEQLFVRSGLWWPFSRLNFQTLAIIASVIYGNQLFTYPYSNHNPNFLCPLTMFIVYGKWYKGRNKFSSLKPFISVVWYIVVPLLYGHSHQMIYSSPSLIRPLPSDANPFSLLRQDFRCAN